MKRILFIVVMCLPMMVMAQKKVAVYVTSDAPSVDNATQQIIGGELVAAIVRNGQYRAVERTADFLKQINKEQGYQHSGNVDDQQISALGKQFGVDYVCVASIMPYRNSYYLQARMIDVETATVQNIARETSSFANLDEIMVVASKVAEQLLNPDEAATTIIEQETMEEYGKLIRLSKYERKLTENGKEYQLGETEMDQRELTMFFNKNCNRAFSQFYNGNNCIKAGWVMFGVGAFMTVAGFTTMGLSEEITELIYPRTWESYTEGKKSDFENCDWAIYVTGVAVGSVGAASVFFSSSIILPVGYSLRSKAIKTYNNQECKGKQRVACTFNLQSSRDGFGLALTF